MSVRRRRSIEAPPCHLPDYRFDEACRFFDRCELWLLLQIIDCKAGRISDGPTMRISADLLAIAKETLATRVLIEHAGAYEDRLYVIRSDGERFQVELKVGP